MMSERSDEARCPACGAPTVGALAQPTLCAACLLSLALERDRVPAEDEEPGPGPAYRVLAVLDGAEGRTTYLAEQQPSGLLVTLDVVRPAQGDGATIEVFRARLQALTRLSHPVIAPVIDGRPLPGGEFCVVARYVSGASIARYCAHRRPAPAERARLFVEVGGALQHAHEQGVVHGRIEARLIVVCGTGASTAPVVTGFGMWRGRPPGMADDLAGLRELLRAVGGPDLGARGFASVAALLEAVAPPWPADR
jgi:hypothetical protein